MKKKLPPYFKLGNSKTKWRIFKICVAFSEYLNFSTVRNTKSVIFGTLVKFRNCDKATKFEKISLIF